MAEEEESWDTTLDQWVVSEGFCYAAGMAQAEDGVFYAAAPEADTAGWGFIFKEDHEEEALQDDGVTTKKIMVHEASGLKKVIETGFAPPGGLWLGGLKYNVTQRDLKFELNDQTYAVVMANRPKMGVHIVKTATQIVCGFYDENKGQQAGNAKRVTLAFAEYLMGIGY